jgi:hypothetical protein
MGIAFFGAAGLVYGFMLVGACIWGLIGLLLMKEITGLEFIVYAGLFLGVVLTGMIAQQPGLLLLAAAVAIAFPLSRRWGNAHALAVMERRDIAKYRETIQKRPEFTYPYQRLAEIYFKQGHYELSLEWYRKYLELAEDPDVKFRVKRCMDLMEQANQKPKLCTECRKPNPSDARYCGECGAILPGAWEIIQAFRGKAGMRYLISVAVASLAAGIVLGLISGLPYLIAMLFFWIAAAATVYLIYKRVTAY